MMADASMQRRGKAGQHFCEIGALANEDVKDKLMQEFHRDARRVTVPKGALFLWSSRTLHQGWSGGPRLAQPVCWEPTTRRDEIALSCKIMMASLGLPSTHWASLGIRHYLVALEPCAPSDTSENLPVKAAIRLASLRQGVAQEDFWRKLKDCDWNKAVSQELLLELKECLNESVLAAL
mmetsp:Transcript_63473/g.112870  ORF Transcript_63473/g.112870 Transcript_63473/m.112870 type:complete len:179 (+) Transcript_63473:865-1401(+)